MPEPRPTRPRTPRTGSPAARAARTERQRRAQQLRLRRRDLLVDVGIGFLLMIVALILTSGLGVIALIAIPVTVGLIASVVVERRRRNGPRRPRRATRR